MRADHDGVVARATQIGPQVASFVCVDLYRQRRKRLTQQRARSEPLGCPAQATAAFGTTGTSGKLAEIGNNTTGVVASDSAV